MTPPLGTLLSPTGTPVIPASTLLHTLLAVALTEQGYTAEEAVIIADGARAQYEARKGTTERMATRIEEYADGVAKARETNAGE